MKKTQVLVLKGKVDAKDYVAKNSYPKIGQFVEEKDLQKFYKQLDMAQLIEWAGILKAEYKPTDNEAIYRMRVAMAILYTFFPKQTAAKKESKYKSYTTEALIQLCLDESVPVEVTDDMRIMRMRAIMALRASGKID